MYAYVNFVPSREVAIRNRELMHENGVTTLTVDE